METDEKVRMGDPRTGCTGDGKVHLDGGVYEATDSIRWLIQRGNK